MSGIAGGEGGGGAAACVWGSHLGQEVSRLSSYAFQNERGFLVQIGVLG